MEKKEFYKNSKMYNPIREQLTNKYSKELANLVFNKAEMDYKNLVKKYTNLPKPVHMHTDKGIFPRVAMYKALKSQISSDEAMHIIEENVAKSAIKQGEFFRKFTKLKFMRPIFLSIFKFGTKNMFGDTAGFKVNFYSKQKNNLKFDILKCPYCKYCKECECEELTHTFCKSDEYCYGNLHGIKFERKQTLGTGGNCCDFYLEIISK